MRVVSLTIGTRGDVQPFVALHRKLEELALPGDSKPCTTIVTSRDFRGFVEGHGLHFSDCGMDTVHQDDAWLSAKSFMEVTQATGKYIMEAFDVLSQSLYQACIDFQPDVILVSSLTFPFGKNIAEKLNVPCWIVTLAATVPSMYYGPDGYYPHAGLVRRWSNWCRVVASMIALAWANRKTLLPRFAKWRTDVLHMKQNSLGGELESYRLPTLVCTSPLVFPPAPDFKPEVFVPGFLFLDAAQADRQEAATTAATASVDARHTTAAGAGAGAGASAALLLPPELAAFLERCGDSDRPVCVNFGSMIAGGGRAGFIADIVCAVVHDLGLPCVLIAGWNTFDEATAARMNGRPAGGSGSSGSATHPRLCCVRSVPHEAIFPRCAAVVHHGGSGTTARVLLSGVPSVVIPILHWSDQPQFGIATQRLGVGVCIREQATRARVVAAVRQVVPEDEAQREAVLVRCRAVAARMEGEDGVVGAAEALSHCLCAAVKPKTAADVRFLKRHCVPCTMRERGVKNDSGGVGGGDGDKPGWVRYRVQQGMWESMGLCVKLLLLVLVLGTAWMWLRHR